MKTKKILVMICLLCSSITGAQNNVINKFFDKYENEDDITAINISKAIFKMLPNNVNTGQINMKSILNKIETMRLITSHKTDLMKKMSAEFKSLINNDKYYEELIRIKDNKSIITFNVKKKGESIKELIMIMNDENNFTIIYILGDFILEEIQEIVKNSNIQLQ
jgi:vacuolar-type H+-ATPase subunit F/Vma7